MPDSRKLLRRRERLFVQGVERDLLSREDEAGGHAARSTPSACRRWRSTTPSTRCPRSAVLENWARATPEAFRFAIKASRRITHMSRLKADSAADSVAFLYRNLATLGAKRGPVLFQLPPFLKKDLPRLSRVPRAAARGARRGIRIPQRQLVLRRRLRRAEERRRRALPVGARGQRAAAAGGDRAVGLRAAAAGDLFRRRPGAMGCAAGARPAGARSTCTSCTSRPRPPMRRP